MSPKSRGRKQRRPQHRPRDKRRAHVRAARETIPPELLSMMLSAGKDMLRGDGPLEAEEIASALLGVWWGHDLIDAAVEEVLGEALVAEAGRRRSAESLTLLTALASVSGGRLAIKAATAAQALDQVGVTGPAWLDQLGRAEPVTAYRGWDVSGDAFSVTCLFAYDGEEPHAVCVLVDRNLGGLAKDAWATDAGQEVVDRYQQEAAASDLMTMEEVDPALARELVEDAFEVTDRALRHDPPISDELRSFRAQVLARMRLLPERPQVVELSQLVNTSLPEDLPFHGDGWDGERDRFLATDEAEALGRPRIVKGCVDAILEYGGICDDGRFLRVSPVKNELLLTDWLPTWAHLSSSQVAVMPEVLRLWSRHAAARAGQPQAVVDEALASIDQFSPGLAAAVAAADKSGYRFLREVVAGDDVWERADEADRLVFALLADPGPLFDPVPGCEEDDLHEVTLLAHPETDEEQPLTDGPDPDDHEVEPRMHLMLHDVIACQLWNDNPREVWPTARRLRLGGYDPHEIHHMLAYAVTDPLRRGVIDLEPFDLDHYLTRLAELPGSWEALRQT